jgi:hypothetical protein
MGRSNCVGGLRSCSNALCCVISQKAGELRCCTWWQCTGDGDKLQANASRTRWNMKMET